MYAESANAFAEANELAYLLQLSWLSRLCAVGRGI